MPAVSTPPRNLPWQTRRQAVNLLDLMAAQKAQVQERLAQLRDTYDLTQEEAAAKVGVNLRQWQRWEAGDSRPYTRNLEAVARAFGVSTDDILGASETQLDRIERRLDALYELLTPSDDAEALEADLDDGARRADTPAASTAPSGRGQRRKGRAS